MSSNRNANLEGRDNPGSEVGLISGGWISKTWKDNDGNEVHKGMTGTRCNDGNEVDERIDLKRSQKLAKKPNELTGSSFFLRSCHRLNYFD